MAAGTLHLIVEQGIDFLRELTIEQPKGTPVDITGYTFKGQIRQHQGMTSPLIGDFTFNIVNPTAGRVDMSLADTVTNAYNPGTWAYDVEYTDTGGTKKRLVRGDITVVAGVTTT